MASVRECPLSPVAGSSPRAARRAASGCLPKLAAAARGRARRQIVTAATAMASGLARLKTRADFLRVAATRRRAVRPGFVLQAAPRQSGGEAERPLRIGYTASRRVGNAVIRNRAKRRLRAAAAEVLIRAGRPGTDYVLIARQETGKLPYAELIGALESALRQVARQLDGRVVESASRRNEES